MSVAEERIPFTKKPQSTQSTTFCRYLLYYREAEGQKGLRKKRRAPKVPWA